MELKNAFGNVYLELGYHTLGRYIYCRWRGYLTRENLIAGGMKVLELLEQHKCSKILNNHSEVHGPWIHSTDWIVQEWRPRAIALGLTHFASVASSESLSNQSFHRTRNTGPHLLNSLDFESEHLARRWLEQSDVIATEQAQGS